MRPNGNGSIHKIALVGPYDFAYPGGVQSHISSLARTYQDMGLEVRVIGACSDTENEPELLINASTNSIPFRYSGSTSHLSLSARAYGRIGDILREEAFDVVHLHEPLTPTIPFYTLLQSKSVNVGTFHAYRDTTLSWYQAALPFRKLMDRLDGRICVSPEAREYVSRFFPGDYTVIPNGIDYDFFAADVAPIERFNDGRPNILFVGRLDKRKGFKYLIEAYEYVKRACPEVRLIVVGGFDAEAAEPFLGFSEDRRLPDVHFVGYVTHEELRRYYRTCDIYCAPSTGFESFGVVLIEAMAAGKAVVASDIPGYRYVMEYGRQGVLVPPEDSEALAQALIKLARDEGARRVLGERGRARAVQFAWPRVALTLLDFYKDLKDKKRESLEWYLTS